MSIIDGIMDWVRATKWAAGAKPKPARRPLFDPIVGRGDDYEPLVMLPPSGAMSAYPEVPWPTPPLAQLADARTEPDVPWAPGVGLHNIIVGAHYDKDGRTLDPGRRILGIDVGREDSASVLVARSGGWGGIVIEDNWIFPTPRDPYRWFDTKELDRR